MGMAYSPNTAYTYQETPTWNAKLKKLAVTAYISSKIKLSNMRDLKTWRAEGNSTTGNSMIDTHHQR